MNKVGFSLKNCRVCKSPELKKALSFGPTPLANNFLTEKQKGLPELFFPLDVFFCTSCSFLQLGYVVNPKLLFDNYVYVSSTSQVFVNHFKLFSEDITREYGLNNKSLVVDIGSNDGILLMPYKDSGIKVLGIEPAKKIATIAKKKGIPTIDKYFSVKVADEAIRKFGRADVVTATNVFAHIDDLDVVIEGVKKILNKNGVFIIEAPYLIDFIKKRYFDLVYHEHLSYWSISTLSTLFKRFDMEVFDVKKVGVHGGSIRVFVKKKEGNQELRKSVKIFKDMEVKNKLNKFATYREYERSVLKNKSQLINLLVQLKLRKKKIVGYGAPAKGNTLLNYFKIGNEILDYIVDDSPFKQGLYSPGARIKVVSSELLHKDKPDYILILAWNFKDSIIKNNGKLLKKSRFIVPAPKPEII